MTQDNENGRGNERLAAILSSGQQRNQGGEQRPGQEGSPQEAAGEPRFQPGEPGSAESMMQTQASQNQPTQPQAAYARTRSQSPADSENIDPGRGSERLKDVMQSQPPEFTGGQSYSRVAGEAAGSMTKLAAGVTIANSAMNGLANRVLRVNEGLAQFNGEIAAANALASARQIQRQMRQGQIIGPEYARMQDAQQDYRDVMTDIQAPLQSAAMDIYSSMLELRNNALNTVAPAVIACAEALEWLADRMPGGDDDADVKQGANAFLSDLSDGKFDGKGTSYFNPGNRPLMSDADRRRIFGP